MLQTMVLAQRMVNLSEAGQGLYDERKFAATRLEDYLANTKLHQINVKLILKFILHVKVSQFCTLITFRKAFGYILLIILAQVEHSKRQSQIITPQST